MERTGETTGRRGLSSRLLCPQSVLEAYKLLLPILPAHSHLVTIEAGTQLLSDVVISSPILTEGGGGAGPSGSGGQGGGGAFEFGVDPSMDPELAMVSRYKLRS